MRVSAGFAPASPRTAVMTTALLYRPVNRRSGAGRGPGSGGAGVEWRIRAKLRAGGWGWGAGSWPGSAIHSFHSFRLRGCVPVRGGSCWKVPTGRVREFDRSSRLGRDAYASAGADVDGRAERPESRKDWAGRRPPEPDPGNTGEGNPSRRSSARPGSAARASCCPGFVPPGLRAVRAPRRPGRGPAARPPARTSRARAVPPASGRARPCRAPGPARPRDPATPPPAGPVPSGRSGGMPLPRPSPPVPRRRGPRAR